MRASPGLTVALALGALASVLAQSGEAADRAADAKVEKLLLKGRVIESRPVGEGITRPSRLVLKRRREEVEAIFKTVDLKRPPRRLSDGSWDDPYIADRWQHEVAAYRIDRLLGLGMTPVTVAREVDGRKGSVQEWIPGATTRARLLETGKELPDPRRFEQERERMRVFDALIYNADRNDANVLIELASGRVWAIDHSRAFRTLAFFPGGSDGDELRFDPSLIDALRRLDRVRLEQAVDGLLEPVQVEALWLRREKLLEVAGRPAPKSP